MKFTDIDCVHKRSGAEYWLVRDQVNGRSYKGDRGVYHKVSLRISDQIISIQNKIKQEFKK